MKKLKDKILKDLLTQTDGTRLLHACCENMYDSAFIDIHLDARKLLPLPVLNAETIL